MSVMANAVLPDPTDLGPTARPNASSKPSPESGLIRPVTNATGGCYGEDWTCEGA